jgi:primary-amine oxidase
VVRGRKLIISHVFTAANYEYCVYWIMHQDGVVQLDIKLTGILNTYSLAPGESAAPWGTEVYPGVNAHNHQHVSLLSTLHKLVVAVTDSTSLDFLDVLSAYRSEY